jgi:putative endonuclease
VSAALERSKLGKWGEDLAAKHLASLGWTIAERNWRCSTGELDLIALEPVPGRAPNLVVIEVKTKSGLGFGNPLEAITATKLLRLRGLACQWRRAHPGIGEGLRIDAIGITKPPGFAPRIAHVRNIS